MTAHSRPPLDEDDDQDLRALYRTLPRAEPSPTLDAAVRAAAARAAAADHRAQTRRRLRHPGWGVAASIVLTAGLVLLVEFQRPDHTIVNDAPPVDIEPASPPLAAAPPATAPRLTAAPTQLAPQARSARPAPSVTDREQQASTPSAVPSGMIPMHESTPQADTPQAESDARIAHIRELLRNGQNATALQALQDLRRDAPDLTLPPDLQALLPATR
uniref:hypothetical protein n=1 Tax=Castellaniella defragrans TaxID=75697 RepID=UPI00333FBF9F